MSTNKTENLGLHSWVRDDPVKMQEFNENFAAIDAAVGARPCFAYGTYTGDGTSGSGSRKTLTFDFEPKLLFVTSQTQDGRYVQILAPRGTTRVQNSFNTATNTEYGTNLAWNGNSVSYWGSHALAQFDMSGYVYFYVAIG